MNEWKDYESSNICVEPFSLLFDSKWHSSGRMLRNAIGSPEKCYVQRAHFWELLESKKVLINIFLWLSFIRSSIWETWWVLKLFFPSDYCSWRAHYSQSMWCRSLIASVRLIQMIKKLDKNTVQSCSSLKVMPWHSPAAPVPNSSIAQPVAARTQRPYVKPAPCCFRGL